MVLQGFQRALDKSDCRVVLHRLQTASTLDPQRIRLPKAAVYVVDAHAPRPATEALVAAIRQRDRNAYVMFAADRFDRSNAFALLHLGAKALLSYSEAHEQLPIALQSVAAGGFWVPRTLLSKFVDSILSSGKQKVPSGWSARLTRRELEVLTPVLDNLSNKEIANKLKISERTVRFHVSSILTKFGVRRRADLLLLWYQQDYA